MKNDISFRKDLSCEFDAAIDRVTKALQSVGFGVLTRIDMHTKIKEKLGKEMPKLVILGACNPLLAYEAFAANSDVASLLPCNAVVRETRPGMVSVELVKPSSMMKILGDEGLTTLSGQADARLLQAIESL